MNYKPRKKNIDILVAIDAIKDYNGEWDGIPNYGGQNIDDAIDQLEHARERYSEAIKGLKDHRRYLIKTGKI